MNKKVKAEQKENKKIKRERKEAIKSKRHKWVHWKCKSCKKVVDIMISPQNAELFTEARRKKFICITCN